MTGREDLPRRVPKPWGEELVWALTAAYCGKRITIEPGRRLSLQLHLRKDESILVLAGCLRLHLEDEEGAMHVTDLEPGESRRIAPGRRHRFEAVDSRVELIEVSTTELDDVVRIEDDFGREGTSAP